MKNKPELRRSVANSSDGSIGGSIASKACDMQGYKFEINAPEWE